MGGGVSHFVWAGGAIDYKTVPGSLPNPVAELECVTLPKRLLQEALPRDGGLLCGSVSFHCSHPLGSTEAIQVGGAGAIQVGGTEAIQVGGIHPEAERLCSLGDLADRVRLERVVLDILLDRLDLLGVNVVLVEVLERLQESHVRHELLGLVPGRLAAQQDADRLQHQLYKLGRLLVRLHLLLGKSLVSVGCRRLIKLCIYLLEYIYTIYIYADRLQHQLNQLGRLLVRLHLLLGKSRHGLVLGVEGLLNYVYVYTIIYIYI